MQAKLKQHIATHFPFLMEKKLLIAISGGLDSVVLAHLLYAFDFDISFAHCNFNLRGADSDADEAFVKELGKKLNIKTHTISFQTEAYIAKNRVSTQIAARELRYHWFDEIIEKYQFDYVATAHHADDNLETFLINLTRGTGLEGLTGIPPINKNIVRPLLLFSREEIEHFAIENNITWREDLSNKSTKYTRNKIRLQVTPILKEINPNLLESFQKTISYLQESKYIINDAIDEVRAKVTSTNSSGMLQFDISKVNELSSPKAYLFELLKKYGFTEWNDVADLLTAQSGKQVISKSYRLIKDREFLLVSPLKKNEEVLEFYIDAHTKEVKDPISLSFEITTIIDTESTNVITLDFEKLTFPLALRKWKNGDYFYPKGMQGRKKLSKFFKDEKFSLVDKENAWLLCSNDQVVWIINHRVDKRFVSAENTNKCLKINTMP